MRSIARIGLALAASTALAACDVSSIRESGGLDDAVVSGEVPDDRVFSIGEGIRVPDGTLVYPFLNSKDATSGLPWDLVDGFSVAAGDIEPGQSSKIHLMPVASQVTFVLEGELEVRMKEPESVAPYTVRLQRHQAVLTKPYVFMQLINRSEETARVLYLVTPPYLYSIDSSGVVEYDDAISFDLDWENLESVNWRPENLPDPQTAREIRAAAYERAGRARRED